MHVTIFDTEVTIDESLVDESTAEIERQVREYEAGERTDFDLTVAYPDDYTGRVMRAMSEIPYGEVRTYGDVASSIDSGARAVGGACARNPVPLVVPCHRIVRTDGIGNFAYPGLKEQLLGLEGADV
ncbi:MULTISPECIES: methylated-DNA--[protein]-cysteine S-methyltransferase [unclassified Haladaptatus]|uniref:methylated-DNA--[protein]-cysteine S-methyltransferase n=1 Tax=unclassified Haladaptatus TaxID=2622732 RepID=UPI0023E826B4|nr:MULTISPECIES: methylated-DNA--[protein]-cysteine S-methyltransferase [unclassified Haladaptatus]